MKSTSQTYILTIIILFMTCFSLSAGEPIAIGASNLPTATAFNNARRIVRDSNDSLFVFYQDSMNNRPVIWTTFSLHGETWSEPEIFAYGSSPAVNISEKNIIYVAYVTEDQKGITIKSSLGDEITTGGLQEYNCPSIEMTSNAVHVLWQAKREDLLTKNIFYQEFHKDLTLDLPFFKEVLISKDTNDSKSPVICGSLSFSPDMLHILWTDSSLTTGKTFLSYVYLDDHYYYPTSSFPAFKKVINSEGYAYPSISAEWERVTFTCCDLLNNGLVTAYAEGTKEDGLDLETTCLYKTNKIPMPGADDVVSPSCAIVWQDNNEIYYGQTEYNYLIDSKAIQISASGPEKKMGPRCVIKESNGIISI